ICIGVSGVRQVTLLHLDANIVVADSVAIGPHVGAFNHNPEAITEASWIGLHITADRVVFDNHPGRNIYITTAGYPRPANDHNPTEIAHFGWVGLGDRHRTLDDVVAHNNAAITVFEASAIG